jgi:hypothetical protein
MKSHFKFSDQFIHYYFLQFILIILKIELKIFSFKLKSNYLKITQYFKPFIRYISVIRMQN